MKVKEAENRLKRSLVESGFDFRKPNPLLGWTVFKEFAREAVDCAGTWIYLQIGVLNPLAGGPFRFELVRYFSLQEEVGDYGRLEHVHLLFTCRPTQELKNLKTHLWSHRFSDLDSCFGAVESLPEFRGVMSHSAWNCHVHPEVSGYQIISELARDGEAAVYKARDLQHKRGVALPVLRSANADARSRLFRACHCMAAMQHPAIVAAYAMGEIHADTFIAMELVEGGKLADKLGKPWPARQAAEITELLANAVHGLHQRGVIHREINPSHILLTLDGQPKLTGFTRPLFVMETAQGHGVAADVYALGAILYELLTGRPPCGEGTTQNTSEAMEAELRLPMALEASVPSELETICLKCLAKKPEDRYGTAEALGAVLRRYLQLPASRPLGALKRGWRWLFQRRA
jgi:tRNA A-37 threonylcarbamoyl transferase component Bud32